MSFGFRTNCVDGVAPELIDDIINASVGVEVSKSGGNNKCKIVEKILKNLIGLPFYNSRKPYRLPKIPCPSIFYS